jgi:hypothetical protein
LPPSFPVEDSVKYRKTKVFPTNVVTESMPSNPLESEVETGKSSIVCIGCPLLTRLTFPVSSSITKKSLGAKNEIPVGRVNPLTTMSNLKEGSFNTGAAMALLSFDENKGTRNRKDKTEHPNIILRIKVLYTERLRQWKLLVNARQFLDLSPLVQHIFIDTNKSEFSRSVYLD